jgi:CDP-glucose 4,6-dehydratase
MASSAQAGSYRQDPAPTSLSPFLTIREHALQGHRILLTGASGFVGAALTARLLEEGAQVTTILAMWDPQSYLISSGMIHHMTIVIGSIEDYDTVQRVITTYGIDTVIHLAAVAIEGQAYQLPRQAFEVNIRGTYNLLEACRTHPHLVKRVIIASSDKVYGDSSILPYVEDMPLLGRHPYDASKVCSDVLAQSYYHSYGLPVVIGRFGNIFGGGDVNWGRLIPGTIRRLLMGQQPVLRIHPHGSFRRDFLYIQDAVNAYIAMLGALDEPEIYGHAFNFAIGESCLVADVIHEIQRLVGKAHLAPQTVSATHGEILQQHMAIHKARHMLRWFPCYTLTAGLAETVEWYMKFHDGLLTSCG